MNARWLEQLDLDKEGEQVREQLWEELMREIPREGVRAALAASRLGRESLRQKLEELLSEAMLQNEAVWWELYEALPTCRRATLTFGKRLSEDYFAQQSVGRVTELLQEALVRQKNAPTLGYSLQQEGTAVRVALVLSLARQCARQRPGSELRGLLEPLKRFAPTLSLGAPELAVEVLEVRALIESVTRELKDLPLPAASVSTSENLPLPATAQERTDSESKPTKGVWKWLKTRFPG